MMNKSQRTGREVYGNFNKESADRLVERLDLTDLSAGEKIPINKEEKTILFEMLRAATELELPGSTLLYSTFEHNFAMGQVKWGSNVIVLEDSNNVQ